MPAYQPSELPPDDADFGPITDEITAELLTLTWELFDRADRTDLQAFLTSRGYHPHSCVDWYLDSLQFDATRLHHRPDPPPGI